MPSRCFVEDKRPLCQLSSKRLEDNWHSDLLSSTVSSHFSSHLHVGYGRPPSPICVEERSPPPTVSRVWVAAVSAARRVSLRRALLVARVSNDYTSGS